MGMDRCWGLVGPKTKVTQYHLKHMSILDLLTFSRGGWG